VDRSLGGRGAQGAAPQRVSVAPAVGFLGPFRARRGVVLSRGSVSWLTWHATA